MYGLPKDIDLRFLEQNELQNISVGKYAVILNFEAEITMTIQSRFVCSVDERSKVVDEKLPSSASGMLALVGDRVIKADGCANGTLKLTFSSGEYLVVYDDDPNYESYVITRAGNTVVVV